MALFCTGCCIVQCLVSLRYLQYIATSPGSSSNSIHELGLGFPSRTLSSPAIGCPLPLHKPMQVSGCDTGGWDGGREGRPHMVLVAYAQWLCYWGVGGREKGCPHQPLVACYPSTYLCRSVVVMGGGGGGRDVLNHCWLHYPSTSPCRSVVVIQVGRWGGWSGEGEGCPHMVLVAHAPFTRSCRSVVVIQVGRWGGWSGEGEGCPHMVLVAHAPFTRPCRSVVVIQGGGVGKERDVLTWCWLLVQVRLWYRGGWGVGGGGEEGYRHMLLVVHCPFHKPMQVSGYDTGGGVGEERDDLSQPWLAMLVVAGSCRSEVSVQGCGVEEGDILTCHWLPVARL